MTTHPTPPTEEDRLLAERLANRAQQTVIEAEMYALSARLRDLRIEERDLTCRIINAHFTPDPSVA